jgi:hypothetical protein
LQLLLLLLLLCKGYIGDVCTPEARHNYPCHDPAGSLQTVMLALGAGCFEARQHAGQVQMLLSLPLLLLLLLNVRHVLVCRLPSLWSS